VCTAEVVVVRAPQANVDLCCGGQPMLPMGQDAAAGPLASAHRRGTQLGKRYADEDAGLELLCTKTGEGSLSLGEAAIPQRNAKPLPSSD
jgi:hypothetical protein